MKYLLSIFSFALSVSSVAQTQIGQNIVGDYEGELSGYSVSMPNRFTFAIGSPMFFSPVGMDGRVRVYELYQNSWYQKGSDLVGDLNSRFGTSVSMPDSKTLGIGAFNAINNQGIQSGHVRVYSWMDSVWVQRGQDLEGSQEYDYYGYAVSMPDSNTIAIGASGAGSGEVSVFSWNGQDWVQKGGTIVGDSLTSYHSFGTKLQMPDSNTVAVKSFSAGALYEWHILDWDGFEWIPRSGIFETKELSMADSNNLVIGSPLASNPNVNSGLAIAYEWLNNEWIQRGTTQMGPGIAHDLFGFTVSMPDKNTFAVDSRPYNSQEIDSSTVRVFAWAGTDWFQLGEEVTGEYIGYDDKTDNLSMSSDHTVCVGIPFRNSNAASAGLIKAYSFKGIFGSVFNDNNQNCIADGFELGILDGLVGTVTPGNLVVQTNETGRWSLDSLPSGTYMVTYDTSGNWSSSCQNSQAFTVTNPDTTLFLEPIGFYNTEPCYSPEVSIAMPFRRRCLSEQVIYVQACNGSLGTGVLDEPYVDLELDPVITVDFASLSFINMGSDVYRFYLDSLFPGNCEVFAISTTVSCDAVSESTLCIQAELLPIDSCSLDTVPFYPILGVDSCLAPYDGSHIELDSWCQNDSIHYSLTNSGVGDMQCFSAYRLFIDGGFILLDSVKLDSGESDTLYFDGDGRTWRLEVDQHPSHPGASHPSVTIELCGDTSNWTPNLVNLLPHDDADPHRDIFCGVVTASYDPNDKTGYPIGITEEHWVAPNGSIDYRIRFQNTGTDTAFTVVIRDTLSTDLDIFSVQSGVSSHDYEFTMYGPRVLQWTFHNIMLPDSGVDYEGSNGFVTFKVDQLADLPDSTEITNSAAIYFDFNDPIITNTSSHVVMREVNEAPWSVQSTLTDTACEVITINNLDYSNSGTYYQIVDDTLVTLVLTISDQYPDPGLTNDSPLLIAGASNATYQWLDCNNGFVAISGETNQSFTATQNGSYAVAVTQMACTDTSACVTVDNVSVLENQDSNGIRVFPNPSSGQVSIDLGVSRENVEVMVFNDLGAKVLERSVASSQRIDLMLPEVEGLYFIRILEDSQPIGNLRVIKMK